MFNQTHPIIRSFVKISNFINIIKIHQLSIEHKSRLIYMHISESLITVTENYSQLSPNLFYYSGATA